MKLSVNISALIGAALLAGSFLFPPAETYQFTFLPESKVVLKGSSNVNTFTCLNPEINGTVKLSYSKDQRTVISTDAVLKLHVVGFDCGNRMMEEDMQEALRAQTHPLVTFEAQSGFIVDTLYSSQVGQYYKIKVWGLLEMAGSKKRTSLLLTATSKGNQVYLNGVKSINMRKFGIEPPTAAFGMIQADEIIHLKMNLILKRS